MIRLSTFPSAEIVMSRKLCHLLQHQLSRLSLLAFLKEIPQCSKRSYTEVSSFSFAPFISNHKEKKQKQLFGLLVIIAFEQIF